MCSIVLAVVGTDAAFVTAAPARPKVVFARVFPKAGRLGLFIAAAD
jgi:hypothetical protein